MSHFLLSTLKILTVATACAAGWNYLQFESSQPVEYASEQRDNSETRVVKQTVTEIGATFHRFRPDPEPVVAPAASVTFDAEWPCFRGTFRDNLPDYQSNVSVPLVKQWDENGPNVLWRQTLGEGYAGAIIANGRAYVLDYLEETNADALRCFALLTGEELWQRSYHNPIRRNHGKSRTVPAFADGVVVSLGPAAHVMAVDAVSGDLLWTRDLVREYQCEVPQWYAGQCPLIDKGKVVLGIGGDKVLMTALDLKTGQTVWELPNPDGINMSHSSVLPTVLAGREQYVYAGIGGIGACDLNGQLLWQCRTWKPAVWAPTPVKIGENRLFLTAGYGAGSALLTVGNNNGTLEAVIEQTWKPTKGPASEQQTPLVIDGTLFVIQPKDAGGLRGELLAADVDLLPEFQVSSGKETRFGLGPYIFADKVFWIVDDDGGLHVYAFENGAFHFLAHHRILPGVDSWGPIACAGGIMILRDSTSMVCLDLRE
ncbi:MAG: PQQ-binding-like beta-propeller repeat protein [Planctomycetaceae bacterium]|nr:PQQ-binding-like beta-propeller repeat protein [Planctomycetaceae bacterium]